MNENRLDLRTPLQKERDQRNKEILEMYNECIKLEPNATKWSIYRVVAEKFGMKEQGIRSIIVRALKDK